MGITLQKIGSAAGMAAICLCAWAGRQRPAAGIEKRSSNSDGRQRTYYMYVPGPASRHHPMPLILLMHGAGGDGLGQVAAWKRLAEANNILLIAPNIPNSARDWDELYDHPEWIRGVIDEVSKEHPVDGRRMYLWGYSAGGMFGFYLAFLESRYFAAAGVHGGVIENFKYQMADFAVRKVPFAYYMGTRDQWWNVDQARATRDALTSRAFTVHYVEMKGADHDFYARSEEITSDAWNFMKRYALDTEPRFDPLDLIRIKQALK